MEPRPTRLVKKVLAAIAGGLLIALGGVMLVTPGPGLLLIAAGLAVLAREFDWAERLSRRAKAAWRDTRRRARERSAEGAEHHDHRVDPELPPPSSSLSGGPPPRR